MALDCMLCISNHPVGLLTVIDLKNSENQSSPKRRDEQRQANTDFCNSADRRSVKSLMGALIELVLIIKIMCGQLPKKHLPLG